MIAFHGKQEIKDFFVNRVRQHQLNDEIRHGYYWENGRGCGIGCTLHSSDHGAYERELGIPRILARIEDSLFESLTPPDDIAWPKDFLDAIPVGADLAMIWPRFFLRLAIDEKYGLLQHVQDAKYAKQKASIQKVIRYYEKWVREEKKPADASATAATAATAASTTDAYAAAYASAYAAADAADASYAVYATDAYADAYAAAYASAYAAYAASDAAYAAYAVYATDAYADAYAADASSDAAYAAYAAAAYASAYASAYAAADAADAAAINAAHRKKSEARLWQSQVLLTMLREAPVEKLRE